MQYYMSEFIKEFTRLDSKNILNSDLFKHLTSWYVCIDVCEVHLVTFTIITVLFCSLVILSHPKPPKKNANNLYLIEILYSMGLML